MLLSRFWLEFAYFHFFPLSNSVNSCSNNGDRGGISLIISGYLFESCNVNLVVLEIGGGVTSIFAGSVGLVQSDLKKVIAYSTCSQLGLMVQ